MRALYEKMHYEVESAIDKLELTGEKILDEVHSLLLKRFEDVAEEFRGKIRPIDFANFIMYVLEELSEFYPDCGTDGIFMYLKDESADFIMDSRDAMKVFGVDKYVGEESE